MALLVVSILGGIPGLGSGADEQTTRAVLATQKIAITDYAISDYDVQFTLVNTVGNAITLNSITLGDFYCGELTNRKLLKGSKVTVSCGAANQYGEKSASLPIVINYTDEITGGEFSQSGRELAFIANQIGSKCEQLILTNQYWNASFGKGCWNTVADPHPICTCYDLNLTRTQLAWDYELQNSIDFLRCQELFGDAGWNDGVGWDPIDSFTGSINGQNNVIQNLFIDEIAGEFKGLFGSLFTGSVNNLGLANAHIVSSYSYVGGLVGYATGGTIQNSYVDGEISATGIDVGGLVGAGSNLEIRNSYAIVTVGGDGYVGGIIGFPLSNVTLTNTHSTGSVSGSSGAIGGLVGGGDVTITNSYSLSFVTGSSSVGGIIGQVSGVTNSGGNSWYNYSGDDANQCVGNNASFDLDGSCTVR